MTFDSIKESRLASSPEDDLRRASQKHTRLSPELDEHSRSLCIGLHTTWSICSVCPPLRLAVLRTSVWDELSEQKSVATGVTYALLGIPQSHTLLVATRGESFAITTPCDPLNRLALHAVGHRLHNPRHLIPVVVPSRLLQRLSVFCVQPRWNESD